jgi:hypothetical protein
VSITETGGIVVSGEASAGGSSDAEASVQSVITSSGSNTNVRVDIKTAADGQEHATSVVKTIQVEKNPEAQVRIDEGVDAEAGSVVVQAEQTTVFERFYGFFTSFFKFIVFW